VASTLLETRTYLVETRHGCHIAAADPKEPIGKDASLTVHFPSAYRDIAPDSLSPAQRASSSLV